MRMHTRTSTIGCLLALVAAFLLTGVAVAGDSADDSTLPGIDEFVPVEVIAEMIHYEIPSYPSEAERMGIEGLVWIEALVGSDGKVIRAVVYKSSGHGGLDEAALRAAPKSIFKPAMQYGRPVAMWVTYKVEFELPGVRREDRRRARNLRTICRVHPKITPLWDKVNGFPLSTEAESIESSQETETRSSVEPDSLDYSRNYGILMLRRTDKERRGLQRGLALIDGGCATGLKVGMKGDVWEQTGYRPVVIANVQVQDVQAFESMCIVKPLRDKLVTRYHDISIGHPTLTPQERLSRGLQYYDDGLFEHALACLESLARLADSNAVVRTRLDECRELCRTESQTPTATEADSLQKRSPNLLEVAESYLRLGDKSGGRRYIDRILRVDSTNEQALELDEAISVLDRCVISVSETPSTEPDSLSVDRLPEMLSYEVPTFPTPPKEFHDAWHARRTYRPGIVWVKALISGKGRVLRAAVQVSSGVDQLDHAATEAAYKNRFKPAISCGRPIPMWVKWKVEFTVEEG